jgi:hypothetical protein
MPFGLQLKSLIIGALLAMFVWPRLMAFISSRTS